MQQKRERDDASFCFKDLNVCIGVVVEGVASSFLTLGLTVLDYFRVTNGDLVHFL